MLNPYPEKIVVDLSCRCNLRCRYCSFFGNPAESVIDELSGAEWKRFFGEAGSRGVMEVVLRGGEPLMREDFAELLETIVANRMRFSLLTNGTLLTPALAARLASCRRCNLVKLSIDGPEDIHDAARGAGSHSGALRALALLRERRLPVLVTAALHRENFRRLERIADYLLRELEVPFLSFSGVDFCGDGGDSTRWALTAEEARELLRRLVPVVAACPERFPSRGPVGLLRRWRRLLADCEAGVPPPPRGGCAFIGRGIGVRADGAVVPCPELADRVLGRVNCDDLAGIAVNSPELARLRNCCFRPELNRECADCVFASRCNPGCRARLDGLTRAPVGCLKCFLDGGGQLW